MANIKDVARVAGVSIATVSRVINGNHKVGDACNRAARNRYRIRVLGRDGAEAKICAGSRRRRCSRSTIRNREVRNPRDSAAGDGHLGHTH